MTLHHLDTLARAIDEATHGLPDSHARRELSEAAGYADDYYVWTTSRPNAELAEMAMRECERYDHHPEVRAFCEAARGTAKTAQPDLWEVAA